MDLDRPPGDTQLSYGVLDLAGTDDNGHGASQPGRTGPSPRRYTQDRCQGELVSVEALATAERKLASRLRERASDITALVFP